MGFGGFLEMTSQKPSKDNPSKQKQILRHAKYLVYTQILAGLCIALIAGQYFNLFAISSDFFGVVIINNFVSAVIIGFVGFLFLRRKLEEIENGC